MVQGETPQREGDAYHKNLVIRSFTIHPAQAEILKELAAKLNRSEGDLIREAIVLLVGEYKNVLQG
jgi:hypothetical protein